jgi:ATP-dependent DNA ligase
MLDLQDAVARIERAVFDILHLDVTDVTGLPYLERRAKGDG